MMIRMSLFLTLVVFASSYSYAKVHDYETARLQSTAGAGVASVLMNEATILNPAPIAFFNTAALYFQKSDADYSEDRGRLGNINYEDEAQAFIGADAKGNVKGSISYIKQQEGDDKRERISAAIGKNIGPKSSMGVAYRHTKDFDTADIENKYGEIVVGVFHAVSPEFTLGATAKNPFDKDQSSLITIGSQYVYKGFIALIFDTGADYKEDLSDSLLYKAAIQFKFFKDFYLRAGTFNDKSLGEKGNGVGFSWVGPRLVVDLAYKVSKPLAEEYLNDISYTSEVRQSSFALAYQF